MLYLEIHHCCNQILRRDQKISLAKHGSERAVSYLLRGEMTHNFGVNEEIMHLPR